MARIYSSLLCRILLLALVPMGACGADSEAAPESGPPVADGQRGRGRRVVAASAGALDYICWLGELERIVALPKQAERYANGLPSSFAARNLAHFANFRAEVLLGYEPDLVLCDAYQNALTKNALREQGVALCVLRSLRTLEDLEANLLALCKALHLADNGRAALARLRAERRALAKHPRLAAETVLPYYELGGRVSSAGRGTSEDLALEAAGLVNHARVLGLAGHGQLSFERILAAPPRWILATRGAQLRALLARPRWRRLEAFEAGRVVLLPSRLRQANSPYLFEAARQIRAAIDDPSSTQRAFGKLQHAR